ncbi:MAG: secreted trypsin-like serine protease, partial [Actinomycetia bacterium]|nr:secreted trypsin-like serine protease [Actinomycetes bacterium]
MRKLVKGLVIAAAAVALGAPAAIASAGQSHPTIVGGTNATETYSFMAALSSSDGWGCGASLIRPTWILTARHCVTGDNDQQSTPGSLTFRIGTVHQNSGGSTAKGLRVVRHDSSADVALVELTAPVSQTPINIATSAPVGTPTRIIGWGCRTDACNGQTDDYLQQLDTSILAPSACNPGANYLCINDPGGNSGACYGDSGGPAIVKSGSSWVQVGDTSGGTGACGTNPSYYTNLPLQRAWIESIAGPDGGGTPPPPPPPGGNLALNKPTKSKQASCSANEGPEKAVNGSVSGGNSDKWCSGVAGAKSLEVDLGANHALTKFVVKHAGTGGEAASLNTKNFILETSTGGGVWTTAATISNNTASTTTNAVSVTARWIRITTTDA